MRELQDKLMRAWQLARMMDINKYYTPRNATVEAFILSAHDNVDYLLRDLREICEAQKKNMEQAPHDKQRQ